MRTKMRASKWIAAGLATTALLALAAPAFAQRDETDQRSERRNDDDRPERERDSTRPRRDATAIPPPTREANATPPAARPAPPPATAAPAAAPAPQVAPSRTANRQIDPNANFRRTPTARPPVAADRSPPPPVVVNERGRPSGGATDNRPGHDQRDQARGERERAQDRDRDRRDWERDRDRDRQDWNGRPESRDWRYTPGRHIEDRWGESGRRWDNRWHQDRRYDWQDWRRRHDKLYRLPRYAAPRGWTRGYFRFSIGIHIDYFFFSPVYWIDDPYRYRLPPAYGPLRWVRYYNDALLVDIRDGYVVDVVYRIFW
jgi:hypothetical protein